MELSQCHAQKGALMIYVGIDIDYDGFHLLTQKLKSFTSDEIIIDLQSTAHYGNNLVEFLVKHKYKICVINPIQTSAMRKNNIRKAKTDKLDIFIISKTLMINPHRIFYLSCI